MSTCGHHSYLLPNRLYPLFSPISYCPSAYRPAPLPHLHIGVDDHGREEAVQALLDVVLRGVRRHERLQTTGHTSTQRESTLALRETEMQPSPHLPHHYTTNPDCPTPPLHQPACHPVAKKVPRYRRPGLLPHLECRRECRASIQPHIQAAVEHPSPPASLHLRPTTGPMRQRMAQHTRLLRSHRTRASAYAGRWRRPFLGHYLPNV